MSSRIQQFHIKKGVRAYLRGEVVIIQSVTGLDSVIVRAVEEGKTEEVKIRELVPAEITLEIDPKVASENKRTKEALDRLDEVAQQKVEITKPLLNMAKRTREAVERRAAEFGRGASTLYEWIAEYGQEREIENLYSKQRSDAGTTRIPSATEDIIQTHLKGLRPEDKCLTKIWEDINYKIDAALSCATANPVDDTGQLTESIESAVQPKEASHEYVHPSLGTIRNRYYDIPKREHEARLHGVQAAEQNYEPALGTIPNADFPLETVQIDHVRLDITVVDKDRKPIRRPWLTIEIDVCSRVIPSFYMSHDAPGVMSTGLCIARGIFPKDEWLAELGSDVQYPIWGKPTLLHGDNAFRLGMLREACKKHGFDLIWRPVKHPRYGGHIERLARTLGEAVHYLPGTTFSNSDERGDYDSDGKAVFTLDEFERWFVERVGKYHVTEHSALGMSPMERYRLGTLKGNGKFPATGLQPQIVDKDSQRRLRLDLLPFEMRTIQRDGVATRSPGVGSVR